jgi:hypothetical protein
MGELIIPLEYPIQVDGKTISKLTLRRLKVWQTKIVAEVEEKEGQFAAGIAGLALMAGISREEVEELDSAEFSNISEKVQNFLKPRDPDTGEPTQQT